jgi:hypothetical protein
MLEQNRDMEAHQEELETNQEKVEAVAGPYKWAPHTCLLPFRLGF